MADGSAYSIDFAARSVGVTTTADELNRLADNIDAAGVVSTQFDSALERTRALLADAGSAAMAASEAVAAGSAKYDQLERAADRAAKAVEKAKLAGKDTAALQVDAGIAAAAMAAQATQLDRLKASAVAADAAQKKLGDTLKTLEKAASGASKGADKGADGMKALMDSAKAGLGPMGGVFEKLNLVKGAVAGGGGWTAAITLATVAVVAFSAALVIGVAKLAVLAVTLNKKAMAKLASIGDTAKKNFAKMFEGVHVEKFTAALDSVSSLLDENSSTAQGLKAIVSAMLNPLFDACTAIAPIARELFRGMVFGALMVAIGVVKVRNALSGMFPGGLLSNVDWMKTAFAVGKVILYAFGIALALLTGLFVVLAVCIAVAIAPMLILIAVVAAVVAGFVWLAVTIYQFVAAVFGAFSGFASSALEAGTSIVTGLVSGIKSGYGMVVDAMKGLASGAMDAFKSAIGFGSPAKEFMPFGDVGIAGGVAVGIDKGSKRVDRAMSEMGEPPDAPVSDGRNGRDGSSSASRGGPMVQGTFNFYGIKDAADAESRFEAMLTRVVEGHATMLGGET